MKILKCSLFGLSCLFFATSNAHAQWSEQALSSLSVLRPTVVAGDFTGDGRIDSLTVGLAPSRVDLVVQDGSNAWPVTNVHTYAFHASSLAATDVDLDGDLDVLTSGFNGATGWDDLFWYENDGTGMQWTQHTVPIFASSLVWSTQLADLDGDGDEDLLVVISDYLGFYYTQVFENDGSGFAFATGLGVSMSESAPVLADWTGDGLIDVVSLDPGFPTSSGHINTSTPGNIQFTALPGIPSAGTSGAGSDWDGDGDQDLIVFARTKIVWLENFGGSFSAPIDLPFETATSPGSITIRNGRLFDGDGDGDLDVFYIWDSNVGDLPRITLMENLGDGVGANPVDLALTQGPNAPGSFDSIDFDGDQDQDILFSSGSNLRWLENQTSFGVDTVCTSQPNSTGLVAQLSVTGSNVVALGTTSLVAQDLPVGQFALFLVSDLPGAGVTPPGSSGTLCLGGAIGRFNAPSQIALSDIQGEVRLALDLNAIPTPSTPVPIVAGQTWVFQTWFRDNGGGPPDSNFSSAVAVTFQ